MFQRRTIQGNFNHLENPIRLNEISNVHDTNNGRYYEVNGEYYPSITTILKDMVDLTGWREFVGNDAADNIMRIAASKGNQLHDLFERYLKNEEIILNQLMPPVRQSFLGGIQTLNRINRVDYQETILWTDKLKIAGRTDVLGQFDGINSVIDFKGSNKPKKKENIRHYFCQATAYHLMAEERLKYTTEQIVILIFPENEKEPQIFVDKPENYMDELIKVRKNFEGEYNG